MAAPFVRDQWSLGILFTEHSASPAGTRGEPASAAAVWWSWCLLGAVWCDLVPLSVQELVSAQHQPCSGIAAWRRPNARLDDADSSVLALRSLAPWKAWKAWFQDVNHAWHLPQPPFELQHHETVAHDRKRRWTRARLANATTHGGLESQPCKGLHIPS